jgi:Phosphoribosylanthranilate isomerase
MSRILAKVCGITRPEDARLAAALGADMLGFIFHPKSPRCVEAALPAGLDPQADLLGARRVGLFVAQTAQEALALMEAGRLDLAQLHGGQDEDYCRALGPERVLKVLWPERAATLDQFQAEIDRFAPCCRMFVVDAGCAGGGHGRAIENTGADILSRAVFPRPWLLAGGLGPDNAMDMYHRFRPSGLDLNSGVESAPGIKDAGKLRAAFAALRACSAKQKGENP